jgi:hypothetical protein
MSADDVLFEVLREASTLRDVQALLQARGFPYSATSWETLIEDRLRPHIEAHGFRGDLMQLLGEAEEFGKQHVFLFIPKPGSKVAIPSTAKVTQWVKGTPDEELLSGPRLLRFPDEPQLAEIRHDENGALVIKQVETRILVELVGEREVGGGRFVREYQRDPVRAVNVVRMQPDGLLEVRIYSHRASTGAYREDVPAMWGYLAGLVDEEDFAPLSLLRAKQALWEQRKNLHGVVRFTKASLKDVAGTTMDCATGSRDAHLFDDAAAEEGLSIFHRRGAAYCDRHNVWWLKQNGRAPTRDVHVLIGGAENEFAVTMQCTRSDYEHVLTELRKFNQ